MKVIAEFIRNKIIRGRHGQLPVPGESPPLNMTRILQDPRNILIAPYKRMGTVLLATRIFRAFREHFSSAKISAVVHESWSVLIQRDPTIDEVITFGDFIENPHSKEFQNFGKELAEKKFDLAFFPSYQFDSEIAYLIRLSEARMRISFSGKQEMEFFNVGIVPAAGTRYEVERYLEMLRTLGINGDVRDYTMTITDKIREKARLRFLPAGPVSKLGRIVGFDLTREIVGEPIGKRNAEHIIKTLVSDLNATVVVFYEPRKNLMAAELKESFGKSIILVEDRPVSLLAGMMSFCKFIVTRNTDLFQLAVALKTPTIGILTWKESIQWSPGESKHLVHLIRQDNSWPSSGTIMQSVRTILKNIRKQGVD